MFKFSLPRASLVILLSLTLSSTVSNRPAKRSGRTDHAALRSSARRGMREPFSEDRSRLEKEGLPWVRSLTECCGSDRPNTRSFGSA